MRYLIELRNGDVLMAVNHGTFVWVDGGHESIFKQNFENAGQALRRTYPTASIFPVAN